MSGNLVFKTRSGGEIAFKINNEHLWERLYHEVAYLAESSMEVSFAVGDEE